MSDEFNAPADLSNLGINLSEMFRPSWTTETSGASDATARLAAKFDEGDRPARSDRKDRNGRQGGGGRAPHREKDRGARREGPRAAGPRKGGGDRGSGHEGRSGGDGGGRGRDAHRGSRDPKERRPEPASQPILEGWKLELVPEEPAIEGIAKQVRSRAKAYPLFELARLILQLSDRYSVKLTPESDQAAAGLFRVKRDGSLWTSRKEALNHLLANHLGAFYRKASVATEPPKGAFTVVAQCGMSGVLLGPPNHHEYTSRIISLHASRFRKMPFEVYKSRIRMVRDESLIEQWKTEQSTKTVYIPMTPGRENEAPASEAPVVTPAAESGQILPSALTTSESAEAVDAGTVVEATGDAAPAEASGKTPAEATASEITGPSETPVAAESGTTGEEEAVPATPSEEGRLTQEEATAHFQTHHAENEVEAVVGEIALSGRAALHGSTQLLRELLLKNLREMDRFPLPLAQTVGKQLTSRGLQLFKSHKKIIHVSMARPRYLDRETTPIGESFRSILEYLEAHPNQRRDKQWAALLGLRTETADTAPAGSPAPTDVPTTEIPAAPDDETFKKREQALGADLLWLLHQGHVIDFAMGNLQAATRPAPKQPSKKETATTSVESTDGGAIGTSEEVVPSGTAEEPMVGGPGALSGPDITEGVAQPSRPEESAKE